MHRPSRRALIRQSGGLLAAPLFGPLARGDEADGRPRPPRIKIGQIGVGHAHATKLSVHRKSEDYEVVGLVEPDDRLREEARSKEAYRGLPWMTREQLLDVPGLRAVLVETRVRDLLDAAEACANAGPHAHLDQPAGESLPQYRRSPGTTGTERLWGEGAS